MAYLGKVYVKPLHLLHEVVPVRFGAHRLWIRSAKGQRQLAAQGGDGPGRLQQPVLPLPLLLRRLLGTLAPRLTRGMLRVVPLHLQLGHFKHAQKDQRRGRMRGET